MNINEPIEDVKDNNEQTGELEIEDKEDEPQELQKSTNDLQEETKEFSIDIKTRASSRWGRNEDRRLFEIIRRLEEADVLCLDSILCMDDYDDAHHPGIKLLCENFNW
eukprot:CAMPEP_0205815224 /NCGR_PEP_ID=MMETSP0205-20121125/20839_1 /ASSEMBLY_ACC=CAM_ASM_000278 /TAXON_ID=36767 /ORGANISM="Euplotes focardii, Strain TN1" /LENGTH=107 /DNA_ID=CAMNT_0053101011 /DNA_START=158 /DNA_END=478 /DNA_ORIENTATION=-